MGINAKEAGIAVSMVIPFSSFGAFSTYLSFIEMDWILLAVVTVAAILEGYPGNWIMLFKLSSAQVKKFIEVILYLLAGKFIYDLMI